MKKSAGVGAENFRDLIENGCYYVDKTKFIKKVFADSQSYVQLIARPRRFGKTLTMSTFEHFLSLNPSSPNDLSLQKHLFKNTWILKRDGSAEENSAKDAFCQQYMGKFPVISLSLKQVEGRDFTSAYKKLAQLICSYLNEKLGYLKDSTKLTATQKKLLNCLFDLEFLRNIENADILSGSLMYLSKWLNQHHEKKCIVLIDEYDVPLAKARTYGYYDEMVSFLRSFLGDALKTNSCVYKAVITGCLRISRESIFTGLNNFAVNTVLSTDPDFAQGIGFTREETKAMLSQFGLDSFQEQIIRHYDGYNIGQMSLVCPWDVVNFCGDFASSQILQDDIEIPNYWVNSSGNDLIEEFLGYQDQQLNAHMQALVEGKSICIKVNETLNYNDLDHHCSDDFWTLMLYTGYLTLVKFRRDLGSRICEVKIPNFEVMESFEDRILNFYKQAPSMVRLNADIVSALLEGEPKLLCQKLTDFLQSYISVRDFATKAKAENYYHGMMNGLLASDPKLSNYRSNCEAGDGYPDIMLLSRDNRIGVAIELKQTNDLMQIDKMAGDALKQIEDKNYASSLLQTSYVKDVFIYGICFCKKVCDVKFKKLK